MRAVMEALRGPPAAARGRAEEGVISRRKGPISRASAFEEEYRRCTRFAKGR
ncbi:unnamed protein product [Phytomonas sp. EM1]|nr:unnamed protein product [Phytomonas sp. EM1]|eukprot:CCW64410.1 unnamed protein product [Phytomonas sp. isolate EM1]